MYKIQTKTNFFDNPLKYRKIILQNSNITQQSSFDGKALACVFLTRFCPVNCDFCFFSSMPKNCGNTTDDGFNDKGIDRFIEFANKANLGYLLISGGGDPFVEYQKLLRVVEEVDVNKIVIVTSGFWATNKEIGNQKLKEISDISKNKDVVIRLSYDKFHLKTLKDSVFSNILDYFENNNSNLKLKVHTILEDNSIDKFLDKISNRISRIHEDGCNTSDSDIVDKINPLEKTVQLNSGLSFKVGYAKMFYPDTKIDLNNYDIIKRNLSVFDKDMDSSEAYNSSIVYNKNGKIGFDFWVNYNGNISTWGNQIPDNIFNLYHHTYEDIAHNSTKDPLSLAYLEKGINYVEDIINEVNFKAVLRSKAINIRDYASAIRLEEDKTKLYCSIRIMQDYIGENRIPKSDIEQWPNEVKEMVSLKRDELSNLYSSSKHNIITQFIENNSSEQEFTLLLELIKHNHYDLSEIDVMNAVGYYNEKYNKSMSHINDIFSDTRITHEKRLIPVFVP